MPGLGYWLHEDGDGTPWLLVSFDFTEGNVVRGTLRLDFDATGITGGWSPAFLNWDDGIRCAIAGISTVAPMASASRSPRLTGRASAAGGRLV
jgi:hypothetical protein